MNSISCMKRVCKNEMQEYFYLEYFRVRNKTEADTYDNKDEATKQ